MVSVQVAKYLACIIGVWLTLLFNLAMTLGFGVEVEAYALLMGPWCSGAVCYWLAHCFYIRPNYVLMCAAIDADSLLLPLVRQAAKDDDVLRPALQVIERQLGEARTIPLGA